MDGSVSIKEKLKSVGISCLCCGSDDVMMRYLYVGCIDCGHWTWYHHPSRGWTPLE